MSLEIKREWDIPSHETHICFLWGLNTDDRIFDPVSVLGHSNTFDDPLSAVINVEFIAYN